MDKFISELKELRQINEKYRSQEDQNDTEFMSQIDNLMQEIPEAKVYVPIIGKFSSGKSALLNTLLGYSRKLLREDITPETAVPAEVSYSAPEETVTIIPYEGDAQKIELDEYRNYEADASKIQVVRIQLDNSFLRTIPDVVLVDMPGFESGYEIHNKAIDNYLPQSMAYMITVPADDMILRKSTGDILHELCLHDMPISLVITKYDKKNYDFDEALKNLQEILQQYIGKGNIPVYKTSSFDGNAEEIEDFLRKIQEQSAELVSEKYASQILPLFDSTELYLKGLQRCDALSESEWEERYHQLENQISELNESCNREGEDFKQELPKCIEEIKNVTMQAIEAEEPTLISMALDGKNIEEKINVIVRSKVTEGYQAYFVPVVNRYLRRVTENIENISVGNIHIEFTLDTKKSNVGLVRAVAIAIGALGSIFTLVAGIALGSVYKKETEKKRKGEAKEKLNNEVYPQISAQLEKTISEAINMQATKVIQAIEKEVGDQENSMKKAMKDVQNNLNSEQKEKETREDSLMIDLKRVGELKNAIQ